MVFGFVNDDEVEEIKPQCKNIVKDIKVECIESEESKPLTFLERHPNLTLAFGMRNLTYVKYVTIAGDTIEELEKIKKEIKEHYQKEYSNCNVTILENFVH